MSIMAMVGWTLGARGSRVVGNSKEENSTTGFSQQPIPE